MMAVAVNVSADGNSLEAGTPEALFPILNIAGGPLPATAKQQYAISADGQRFFINVADEEVTSPITLILNWRGNQNSRPD
jgi:hypothetical protein